jgi:uncharacterized membrane protein
MAHHIFELLTALMTAIGFAVTIFGLAFVIGDVIEIYLRFRKQVINRDRKGDDK